MIKSITKIGNSQGIVLDAALMELARLKVGDQVNVTVHEGGALYLTPVRPVIAPEEAATAAKSLISRNGELFRRLS
jgi:antitoxin component of MazEF toxin-antitoxin module